MSAKRLGILIFVLGFGLNLIGFFFFGRLKAFEDTRSIWLPELPKTAAPWDSGASRMSGPAQGLVGTLARPDGGPHLGETWDWSPVTATLKVRLRPGLTYSTGEPIEASDFLRTREYLKKELLAVGYAKEDFPIEFKRWVEAEVTVLGQELSIQFQGAVDPVAVLSSAWTGVLHPKNQTPGMLIQNPKDWISSGPYIIRKWKPKEVILASRKDFPGSLGSNRFRTVRMSAPSVRNPSSDLVSTGPMDAEMTSEHQKLIGNYGFVHVLAICRSINRVGSVCNDSKLAQSLKNAVLKNRSIPENLFAGKKIAYRIAPGAEEFRVSFPNLLQVLAKQGGGQAVELSSIFDPVEDADLELSFVVTGGNEARETTEALLLAAVGSRFNQPSSLQFLPLSERLKRIIPIAAYRQSYQMKRKAGLPFTDVFVR
jgi:hypothetical protein